jgi:hypothetical protein
MSTAAADPVDGGAASTENVKAPQVEPQVDNHSPQGSPEPSPAAQEHEEDTAKPNAAPLQKRRRVTRACDECRRKKIKCDGPFFFL